jgi:hypothetical protein
MEPRSRDLQVVPTADPANRTPDRLDDIQEPEIVPKIVTKTGLVTRNFAKVSEGTRTPDRLDHNPSVLGLLRLYDPRSGDVRCREVP